MGNSLFGRTAVDERAREARGDKGGVGALGDGLRALWRANRLLTATGLAMLLMLGVTLAGLLLDQRQLGGAPIWLKPAKFAASLGIYSLTLAWLLSYVQGRRRLVALISLVAALTGIGELVVIAAQALRGTYSHFNIGTGFDAALFSVMGIMVILLWLTNLLAAILLLRQRLPDRGFAWSLRLGLLIALIGGSLGGLMLGPTPEQSALLAAGENPGLIGGHSVGVADGGAGLPLVGWSTEGGDVRAAHFLGLHAMQALPLLGWALRRRFGWLSEGSRALLVLIGGLGYLGLVGLLTWQALRGQPITAPDSSTLAALAIMVLAVALAAGAVLRRGRAVRAGA